MAIKDWVTERFYIFCPYCSKSIGRKRFNPRPPEPSLAIFVECPFCLREFVIQPRTTLGAKQPDLKAYCDLTLVGRTPEETKTFEQGGNLFCPFDGESKYTRVTEGASVDRDGDVEIESLLICGKCRNKVNITVLDLQNDSDHRYWRHIKSDAVFEDEKNELST